MRTLAGVLIGIGVVVAVVLALRGQMQVECEVCMVYEGRKLCENAMAIDRPTALRQATSTACAQLSSGVTAGIECNGTRPLSTQCSAP